MISILIKILYILITPLVLLNLFSGIISGTWLAINGEWSLIFYGIVLSVGTSFFIGILLFPSFILLAPASHFMEKKNHIIGYALLILYWIYFAVIVTFWCGFILYYFDKHSDNKSYIPALIWSYGVALFPFLSLARKGGNELETLPITLSIGIGYLISILLDSLLNYSPLETIPYFIIIILIGITIQIPFSIYINKSSL